MIMLMLTNLVTAIILFEMTLLGRGEELSDLMMAAVLSQPEVKDEQIKVAITLEAIQALPKDPEWSVEQRRE